MLCGSMCGRLSDVKHGDIKTRGGKKRLVNYCFCQSRLGTERDSLEQGGYYCSSPSVLFSTVSILMADRCFSLH